MDISINISRTSTRTATLLSKERAQLQLLRGHLFTLAQDLSQPLRMLSDWTGDQINPVFDKDTFSHEFEILGVEASRQTVPQIQRLTGEVMVKKFVDNTEALPEEFGRMRIICTRHRDHLRREIKPAHAAFRGAAFIHILEKFHLPSTYQQIRTHANASGAFFKFTDRGSNGSIQRIGLVIRVPYSPRDVKSIWSMAISWNARTGETTALFDGVSDGCTRILISYLAMRQPQLGHPMVLPMMIMEVLCHYSIGFRNELQRSLYELEVRLGVTRGRPQILAARGTQDTILLLEANTMNCNHIVTSLVYLERRLSFAKSAAERIIKLMSMFSDAEIALTKADTLTCASLDFEEIVGNGLSLVDNQTNLTLCLLKRAFALRDVIFLLIAQQDSRTTKELTRAAKIDSSAMTAIAALTVLFLPGTFVATFFGMNFFQFDENSTTLTIANNAWIFGVIAIPLTITFAVWVTWVVVQNKRFIPKSKVTTAEHSHQPAPRARYATFSLRNWEEEMAAGPCYPMRKPWEPLEVAVPDPSSMNQE